MRTGQSAVKLCNWKVKADMTHVCQTCEWQVKLCDPSSTRAIPERLRHEQLTITHYINKAYFTFTFVNLMRFSFSFDAHDLMVRCSQQTCKRFFVCNNTISPPVGSGAKPQPTKDLVHIWAKKSSSGCNTFADFPENKRNFCAQKQAQYHLHCSTL